jgi:hypothetical protein
MKKLAVIGLNHDSIAADIAMRKLGEIGVVVVDDTKGQQILRDSFLIKAPPIKPIEYTPSIKRGSKYTPKKRKRK